VHETLIDQGLHAPLPGELADEDIEYVCVRMADVRAAVAEAELDAWVAARTQVEAADELSRFLARTDDPLHRDLALHALARTGATGLATAKRLRARPPGPRSTDELRLGS